MGRLGSWSILPQHPESHTFNVHKYIHHNQPKGGHHTPPAAASGGWGSTPDRGRRRGGDCGQGPPAMGDSDDAASE